MLLNGYYPVALEFLPFTQEPFFDKFENYCQNKDVEYAIGFNQVLICFK